MSGSLPKGMEHVDRKELYTSLPVRIKYLQSWLNWTSADVQAINEAHKYIKPAIPDITNKVFAKILSFDITARSFATLDTRKEVEVLEFPDERSSQIQHRKLFLRWFLTRLSSDPSKMEYWEYVDKVGLMHCGKGRRQALHVGYVHLGACLGLIHNLLVETVLTHEEIEASRRNAMVKAINKVIWIQNDLFAKWHVSDGASYLEPILNDIGPEFDDSGSPMTRVNSNESNARSLFSEDKTSIGRSRAQVNRQSDNMSRCPFSGMVRSLSPGMDSQRASTPRSPVKFITEWLPDEKQCKTRNPVFLHPPTPTTEDFVHVRISE